jgi:hypothetical protein
MRSSVVRTGKTLRASDVADMLSSFASVVAALDKELSEERLGEPSWSPSVFPYGVDPTKYHE